VTDRQATAKRRRPPKATDPEEQAAILAYAKLHTTQEASEKFGISSRSIERWRSDVNNGRAPKLAALVEAARKEANRRNADLICETTDQLLIELQSRKTKLSNEELIDAVEKVGNLRVSRDALNPHGEPASTDQPGSSTAASGSADPGGTVRTPGSPGAGESAAAPVGQTEVN